MNNKTGLLTDYHLRQSKAAQQEVGSFLKQPVSLQQARMQVQSIKAQSRSVVKKGHS